MCFYIKTNLNGKADKVRVAKKAIVCYKVVTKGPKAKKTAKSGIRGFKYSIGRGVKAKFDIGYGGSTIEAGLHSYRSLTRARRITRHGNEVMLCVIPKGTEYYQNSTEYCSTRIVPVAFI